MACTNDVTELSVNSVFKENVTKGDGIVTDDCGVSWTKISNYFTRFLDVKDFGAVGDGLTDDTVAIQAAINMAVSTGKTLYFPVGDYRTTDELSILSSAYNVKFIGQRVLDRTKSLTTEHVRIFYDGAVHVSKAVFKVPSTLNMTLCTFENIDFNANLKAAYGLLLEALPVASGTTLKKFNRFINCAFSYATVAGVNIGMMNPWVGTDDVDADSNYFENCQFVGNVEGVVLAAQNIYRTTFVNPFFGYYEGGHAAIALHSIRQIKASSTVLINPFFAPTSNLAADKCCIYTEGGTITVLGGTSEEPRILRSVGTAAYSNSVTLVNLIMNSGADSGYVVYAPDGEIHLQNCDFSPRALGHARKVYVAGRMTSQGSFLGSAGTYELDDPMSCLINGQVPGLVRTMNGNGNFAFWRGSAVDEMPFGYGEYEPANGTIQRDTINNYRSLYSAKLIKTGGAQFGFFTVSILNSKNVRGYKRIALVATGTLNAGAALTDIDITITDGVGNTTGTKVDLGASRFMIYGIRTLDAAATSLFCYFRLTGNVTVWVDGFHLVPTGINSNIDSINALLKYGSYDIASESLFKTGTIPIGDGGSANVIDSLAAMPTTGTWKKGDIILNNNPAEAGGAGSKYIIIGWMRLVTGSANVLNTDWFEMRTLTGN